VFGRAPPRSSIAGGPQGSNINPSDYVMLEADRDDDRGITMIIGTDADGDPEA
jgi:hypothetical protein